jgi:phosphonate transport system substrate-binding protein
MTAAKSGGWRFLAWQSVLMAAVIVAAIQAAEPAPANLVRIGIVAALFRDIPDGTVKASAEPFRKLMESETGRTGEVLTIKDDSTVIRELLDGKVQLGVLQGFEFAWALQKKVDLKPLVIAVNQDHNLRALLVVKKDNPVKNLDELKGKTLGQPVHVKDHCRLFLARGLEKLGQKPDTFFGKTTNSPTLEDAVDDLVDGLVDAALVDGIGLARYEQRKPARFAKVRVLEQSVIFPATVVVYHPGTFDAETLDRFTKALLGAADNTEGKDMLTMWRLTAFEPLPKEYSRVLKEIAKTYPPRP